MITNITLENFKCFRKVEVSPHRITAFIGPNGTGKSSVLQALALLKQFGGGRLLSLQGRLIHLRDYTELQPRFGAHNQTLRLAFSGVYSPPQSEVKESKEDIQFKYEVESVDGELTAKKQEPREIPGQVLRALRIVPATRGLVHPVYSLGGQKVDDISHNTELSEQGQQISTNLAYSRQLEGKLSGLLKQVTGVGLRAELVPSQSVELRAIAPVGQVNIVAEGFGTNALILLFLQLVNAAKGATVLIEEPEIHLHPRAQAELASLLVEEAKVEDKQIIMTTHSEHILGRLLTLVAEKQLVPDELAIYAFEKDDKGECTAGQIEVLEDGRVRGGIKDFFNTHLDELNRYVKALIPKE
jgi:predicted ATPase